MKIIILTLFPGMIKGFTNESILKRAQKKGLLGVELVNLSNWGIGRWKKVDDTPYGGGVGMVLRVDVVAEAIKDLKKKNKRARVILLTPQGEKYSQKKAQKLADAGNDLIIVCGHYEGFDERIRNYVDMEISIGDYILTGGEIAAAVLADSIARLLPGVIGKKESHQDDSFSKGVLEYPHFTKPVEYDGKEAPEILRSGNHREIEKWRREEARKRTKKRRPDL